MAGYPTLMTRGNPTVELKQVLRPEPGRVVIRPFMPSDDPTMESGSRLGRVVGRILDLDAPTVRAEVQRVTARLEARHDDVRRVLMRRYHQLGETVIGAAHVSEAQALLIGAVLSDEYSFEAAALFNPSIVQHPDQRGVPAGAIRFVMSLRGVGEGHVSSITFRTGLFTGDGQVQLDPPSAKVISPRVESIPGGAADDPGARLSCGKTRDLSAIAIFPVTAYQRHGIEDLRLVRFEGDDGVSYIGTYTAFSGETIRQELLRTTDFATFELSALRGEVARTKGMALFPRRIGGHYAALGRQDHESIWLLRSNDLYHWTDGTKVISPKWPWEVVQIGNCSPPIEIDEGWLLIIHGVGPVRNYCLGACLLDKDDPSRLIARSTTPLVTPGSEARDGYVPNVVYTCGALLHGRSLLLPYSLADSFTAFATLPVDALLHTMT
jgi:predicted GH43/DUF377 family glycosyl hydrolase